MKRFLFSLVALTCSGIGCAPERTDLFIQGVVIPKSDPATNTCTFGAGDPKVTKIDGAINVDVQEKLYGKLTSTYGFQLINNVSSPPSQTPPGNSPNPQTRDDAVAKSFDITATDDDNNNAVVVTETVPASGYVPHGTAGVAVGDVISTKFQDALLTRSKSFNMHLGVKVKGSFLSGSDFETGEYSFPVKVIYGGAIVQPPDGGAPVVPIGTSTCE